MKNLKWYEFDQNNSGGNFTVNDKLCHRLFIQAESHGEAIDIAEDLGCYWDGVSRGLDCPCCGDRWSTYENVCDINKPYEVTTYEDSSKEWMKLYDSYEIVEEPTIETDRHYPRCIGKIKFRNIEEYAQYLADRWGWTTPDVRIYYADGTVKEIFKVEEQL